MKFIYSITGHVDAKEEAVKLNLPYLHALHGENFSKLI